MRYVKNKLYSFRVVICFARGEMWLKEYVAEFDVGGEERGGAASES